MDVRTNRQIIVKLLTLAWHVMGYWGTKPAFLHRQTNKKKLISTAIPTLLPYKQISTLSKTSEIRAKQKKKRREKL